jgi:hypothetical protein
MQRSIKMIKTSLSLLLLLMASPGTVRSAARPLTAPAIPIEYRVQYDQQLA